MRLSGSQLVLLLGPRLVDVHVTARLHVYVFLGDGLASGPHCCPGLLGIVGRVPPPVLPLEDTGHGWRGEGQAEGDGTTVT